MPLDLQVDLTSFHIVNNLFDMGLEFITIPTSLGFRYDKKNPITPTVNDFVIEHWKTPPQTLTISGQTRFRILQNFLATKVPWAINLDTIRFGPQTTSVTSNNQQAGLVPVADVAYWLINKMALDDQKRLSEVFELKTKQEIDAKLKGKEDRVRTFIYFNYSIYEVMFNQVNISRDATRVVFTYTLTFTVLNYKSIYDYIFRTKLGKYALKGVIGAELLGDLIKI
jgi:hypothetical protein